MDLNRSVFVGADKATGEVVALKRINTEEEENGFPITAIREVKILKALNHDNIVQLKEIVTSKGGFVSVLRQLLLLVLIVHCFIGVAPDRLPEHWLDRTGFRMR